MKKALLLIATMLLSVSAVQAATTTVIDGNTYSVDTLQHSKVGPESYYTAIKFTGPSLTFRTFYLEVATAQQNLDFRTNFARNWDATPLSVQRIFPLMPSVRQRIRKSIMPQ